MLARQYLECLRPRALLCGEDADIREDSFHIARTRSHLRSMAVHELASVCPAGLFNHREVQRIHSYLHMWQSSTTHVCSYEDLIVHVGDNPTNHGGWTTWSAKSHAVPTLRRAGGLMYSPWARRQVLLRELYAGMGFPTFQFLADAAKVPLFQVFRPTIGLWYGHMRQAVGNAQHVASVGVFNACALASACKLYLTGRSC